MTPPKCPASLILSTMLVLVPSRTIFFSTKGLFPSAMAHFGHAFEGLPGCTTFTMHSWQNVCRHSICAGRSRRGFRSGEKRDARVSKGRVRKRRGVEAGRKARATREIEAKAGARVPP